MGWLYNRKWPDKSSIVKHLLYDDTYHKPLAHSLKGTHLWVAFENTNPACPVEMKRYICLFLLSSQKWYGWGYKDIEECMGPYETDCPVKFFDLVPDPGGYATEWREKVRRAQAAQSTHRKLLKSIQVGSKIQLIPGCNIPYVTITHTKPLKGVYLDVPYRVKPKHIYAIIKESEPCNEMNL